MNHILKNKRDEERVSSYHEREKKGKEEKRKKDYLLSKGIEV